MWWPSLTSTLARNQPRASTRLSATAIGKMTTSSERKSHKKEYPGLGLDLRTLDERGPCYPIGSQRWSQLLPVRELAMMSIMDKLTDKPDWNKKVFDDTVVARWRKEALATRNDLFWDAATGGDYFDTGHIARPDGIVDSEVFDYCVRELRVKARYFEKTGLIPTLDADATVVKSDSLVEPDLHNALRKALQKLKGEQAARPDWHPNSDDKVMDLVHPSMYPLVYGRTRVLREELVGVDDSIEKWAGKGEIISKQYQQPQEFDIKYELGDIIQPDLWSYTYQWLPANMAFGNDGTVWFTSYINNLHPTKHAKTYRVIEQLVNRALPAWEQCLNLLETSAWRQKSQGPGRTKSRFGYFEDPDDENIDNWIFSDPEAARRLKEYVGEGRTDWSRDEQSVLEEELGVKLDRCPRNPPPPEFKALDYSPSERLRLTSRFAESGLQVIVKMVSVELTPDKPYFSVGSWHIEGQMNEHICATALYYVDSDNITPSSLSFRMATNSYLDDDISVGQDSYHWLESTYGVKLGCDGSPALQNYGSVETKPGRLLAFPNIFQHCVSPFELVNKSKPGHRSFIALWLVDPHRRIISTANVPPQQMSWMAEEALGAGIAGGEGESPAELRAGAEEAVRKYFKLTDDVHPMTLREAEEHRLELMMGRTAINDRIDSEWGATYNFCEH